MSTVEGATIFILASLNAHRLRTTHLWVMGAIVIIPNQSITFKTFSLVQFGVADMRIFPRISHGEK